MAPAPRSSARMFVQVDPGPEAKVVAVRAATALLGEIGRAWSIEVLFPDDPGLGHFVIYLHGEPPLTPAQQFDLSYRLLDQPGVLRAEPDLPVDAFVGKPTAAAIPGFGAAPAHTDPAHSTDPLWAHKVVKVQQAWALLKQKGLGRGRGIVVGHPDTGYTDHPVYGPDHEALDLLNDHDFIDNDDIAKDSIVDPPIFPFRFPGHGTGTGGVIAGRDSYAVPGVAPDATLLPMRTAISVVQIFDLDLARSVEACRKAKVDVISMSLGGLGLFGLETAIGRAVNDGIIVLAAAGNMVGFVTNPAAYGACHAISGTNHDGSTWSGASHGRKVLVSAPGGEVYKAGWTFATDVREPVLELSSGTSFAVAHVAGAAALWLEMHGGREALGKKYPLERISEVFAHVLRTRGRVVPAGWNAGEYGAGILDIEALLSAPLPTLAQLNKGVQPAGFGVAPTEIPAPRAGSVVEGIATSTDLTTKQVEQRLAQAGLTGDAAERYGREVLYTLLTARSGLKSFVSAAPQHGIDGPAWVSTVRASASGELAEKML